LGDHVSGYVLPQTVTLVGGLLRAAAFVAVVSSTATLGSSDTSAPAAEAQPTTDVASGRTTAAAASEIERENMMGSLDR
jgi:hypothetical protein